MMLKIWFGKAGAMSLSNHQTSFGKPKNFLETGWMIRAEGSPKYFPGMNEFNDLTKFFNCFADILNAVNFHSMHSKIIGSNDIFLGIIKE